ncbi:MAG: hypothetical protein GQ532_20265 [Methylomarinum sp.]|nr:hypothetical protein [Methylomarinum sp.]
MSFDQQQVASLIRKLGSSDQMLANAYINGTVFSDSDNKNLIEGLKKTGILRTADHTDEFRLSTDVKRLIDRLLLRNLRYRQNTDMAKMIKNVEEDIEAYRIALEQNEQDEAKYHLEQIDDNLYESLELLETSLNIMFSAITSQFGFVNSLTSKIRENERALNYAQQLVKELKLINLNDCYEWLNWAVSPELSSKVIAFIDQYQSIVKRLASIVDRMKTLLFTLRLQEKTANRTRAMAQFLKQHPEWEPLDWSNESTIPKLLKRGSKLSLQSSLNINKSSLQPELIKIVQQLKRQSKPIAAIERDRDSQPVKAADSSQIEYHRDHYETHIEKLFSQVLEKQGYKISALQYWKIENLDIKPELWLDFVFAQHCCLQKRLKQAIALEMEGEALAGFNGNQLISEIYLRRVQ